MIEEGQWKLIWTGDYIEKKLIVQEWEERKTLPTLQWFQCDVFDRINVRFHFVLHFFRLCQIIIFWIYGMTCKQSPAEIYQFSWIIGSTETESKHYFVNCFLLKFDVRVICYHLFSSFLRSTYAIVRLATISPQVRPSFKCYHPFSSSNWCTNTELLIHESHLHSQSREIKITDTWVLSVSLKQPSQ
jgi:hypothetical protein